MEDCVMGRNLLVEVLFVRKNVGRLFGVESCLLVVCNERVGYSCVVREYGVWCWLWACGYFYCVGWGNCYGCRFFFWILLGIVVFLICMVCECYFLVNGVGGFFWGGDVWLCFLF